MRSLGLGLEDRVLDAPRAPAVQNGNGIFVIKSASRRDKVGGDSLGAIRKLPGALVYSALGFNELGEALNIGLKPLDVSKCPRPFVSRPRVNRERIRRTKNDDSKWLWFSDGARVLCSSQRLWI